MPIKGLKFEFAFAKPMAKRKRDLMIKRIQNEILVLISILLLFVPVQIFSDNNYQFYEKVESKAIQKNGAETKNKTILALDSTYKMSIPNWKKDKVTTSRDLLEPLKVGKLARTIDPARDEREVAVERINQIRAEVFSGYKVAWDASLAKSAQNYADHLAQTGNYEHSNSSWYGENLYASGYTTDKFIDAINYWYREKKYYHHASDPCWPCSKSKECRHYTQLVWKKTRKVGCGKAIYKTGQYKGWEIIVCQFIPHGNITCHKPY